MPANPSALTPGRVHDVSLGRPFEGTYDIDEVVAAIPSSYTVKGMYLSPLVKVLGRRYREVEARLLRPPPKGHFVAFKDYPQPDHSRLLFAVAEQLHPQLANSEGLRRIARSDMRTFSESTLGRVTLSLVRDARTAFHKLPFVYSQVAKGDWTFTAEDLGEDQVRMTLLRNYGVWEYQTGQFEGVLVNYGVTPHIRVTELGDGGFQFDIRVG